MQTRTCLMSPLQWSHRMRRLAARIVEFDFCVPIRALTDAQRAKFQIAAPEPLASGLSSAVYPAVDPHHVVLATLNGALVDHVHTLATKHPTLRPHLPTFGTPRRLTTAQGVVQLTTMERLYPLTAGQRNAFRRVWDAFNELEEAMMSTHPPCGHTDPRVCWRACDAAWRRAHPKSTPTTKATRALFKASAYAVTWHVDLHDENVMWSRDGVLKYVDLGDVQERSAM